MTEIVCHNDDCRWNSDALCSREVVVIDTHCGCTNYEERDWADEDDGGW